MFNQQLDAKIRHAHEKRDLAALINLYQEAAGQCLAERDEQSAAFFLTNALVYALEAGHKKADEIAQWLDAHGRH